ncbi:hypothetical protein [Candidatus Bartonella washoeensis]|uniref:Uncharacterized protein n=1 Tax=Cardidatus Bartonella washoeensis 085-0475 TaxID=1094564 RepID=J1JHT8_9HYPH|nr:hypothetical protein [Bartonella washoeensis]EJF83740.1 hypothetical protein MCW_01289 [Bartonella washoeensis 085-0475]
MGVAWGLFLMGVAFFALLQWSLIVLMRVRQDGVMLRCLWLLKGLVFGGSAGVFLLCTRVGAEHMGFSWLWLSKERVFYFIFGFTFPFIYEGARCVRILWDWFLKHVVF